MRPQEKQRALIPSYRTDCLTPPTFKSLTSGLSKLTCTHNLTNRPQASAAVCVSILKTGPIALPKSRNTDGS